MELPKPTADPKNENILQRIKKFFTSKDNLGIFLATIAIIFTLFTTIYSNVFSVWGTIINTDNKRSIAGNSTQIAQIIINQGTQENRILEFNNQLSTLENNLTTSITPNPTSTPTPSITPTQITNPWSLSNPTIKDEVQFSDDFSTITFNSNKLAAEKGLVYRDISNISKVDFNVTIYEVPFLASTKNPNPEDNFQFIIGITDLKIMKKNANLDNYILASIYPKLITSTPSYWKCCAIKPKEELNIQPTLT